MLIYPLQFKGLARPDMVRDQVLGGLVLVVSVVGIIIYFFLIFLPPFPGWDVVTMKITMFAGVGIILAILAWVGYTLATTPPPEPLPEILEEESEEKSE